MKNTAEKIFEAGLGALMVTKDAIEDTVKKLAEKGNVGKAEAKKLADSLIKKGEIARDDIKKAIESTVGTVMKKLDIPTRKEYDELKREVEKLRKAKE